MFGGSSIPDTWPDIAGITWLSSYSPNPLDNPLAIVYTSAMSNTEFMALAAAAIILAVCLVLAARCLTHWPARKG